MPRHHPPSRRPSMTGPGGQSPERLDEDEGLGVSMSAKPCGSNRQSYAFRTYTNQAILSIPVFHLSSPTFRLSPSSPSRCMPVHVQQLRCSAATMIVSRRLFLFLPLFLPDSKHGQLIHLIPTDHDHPHILQRPLFHQAPNLLIRGERTSARA